MIQGQWVEPFHIRQAKRKRESFYVSLSLLLIPTLIIGILLYIVVTSKGCY